MVEDTITKFGEEGKRNIGKVGLIGRFKPIHNGGYALLEAACSQAEEVVIGIGSANKYNVRNPFTADESEGMIRAALSGKFSNYKIIKIPDFAQIPEYADGKKWRDWVVKRFGALDYFVSGNEYVRELLKDKYRLLYPGDIVPKEKYIHLRATEVRIEMARSGDWEKLVPGKVALYLEENGIVEMFREEFGLATLSALFDPDFDLSDESRLAEKMHAKED